MLGRLKPEEPATDNDSFAFTTNFIEDELDLLQHQQQDIINLATEIQSAFGQAEQMKRMLDTLSQIDSIVIKKMTEKKKKEFGAMHTIEEIKSMLAKQKYEDIDRLLSQLHMGSQEKIHLSQEELNHLRRVLAQLTALFQQAAGFYKLLQAMHARTSRIYQECQEELTREMNEEEELNKAGSFSTPEAPAKIARPIYQGIAK